MRTDSLSITFAALADPTRRAILARLAQGGTSVTELAKPFSISPSAVTKHLKVLQHAKLITQDRQHWEQSLDRLDAYLQNLQSVKTKSSGKKK
jgi:DNA-binding transcriptional ArsR family regulator